jgi:hypothetical protein
MSGPRNFVADLAKAKETFSSIFAKVKSVYGDNAMSASQVYRIIALVKKGKNTKDQRPQNPKKTVKTPDIVASVANAVENNRRLNIQKLAQKTHVSFGTTHNILKRPTLADGDWFLHWDNAPVHTAAAIRLWLEEHNAQVIPHPSPTDLIWPQRTSSCFLK